MDSLITAAARTEHPMLTRDNRNAVGGIIKPVVACQIRPLLQQRQIDHANIIALKQKIAAFKAVPVAERLVRGADRDYWPMLAVLKAAGVGPAGRQLVLRCVGSMRRWCIQTGRPGAVKLTTNDEVADRHVFQMSAVDDWMAACGTAIIDAH
jgi:hypothetical protein